jgi:Tol biopolymer transport system component
MRMSVTDHRSGWLTLSALLLLVAARPSQTSQPSGTLGLFAHQSDVGSVVPAGTARYDSARAVYTLTAAGANTWYHVDDFHYLWKRASGDLALQADVSFPPHKYDHEPNAHRKGLLMIRQSLEPGSAYVDAAPHGSGLTALQYRRERGANSQDIELNIELPRTVRLEKRGDEFTLLLSMHGEPLHQVGAAVGLHLQEPFYVGLGVVSHDVATTDSVEFSHVRLQPLRPFSPSDKLALFSTLQTAQIEDQYRRSMMIRTARAEFRSANWAPGGKSIYLYQDGRIVRVPYLTPEAGGAPEPMDTGSLVDCAPDFGVSPDGRSLAVSCSGSPGAPHQIYLLSIAGREAPRQVTRADVPSYFHAWSPDGQIIAFTRGSAGRADIFTIAAGGGAQRRLTDDTLNDGPAYTPDGKFIYFDSQRSGSTQIWRMQADGSGAEQITDDDSANLGPQVSPDGKTLAFLSRPAHQSEGIGAAALKVMVAGDGMIRTVASFQGQRDSFSTYAWGDNNHLAFVSYQRLPASDGAAQ